MDNQQARRAFYNTLIGKLNSEQVEAKGFSTFLEHYFADVAYEVLVGRLVSDWIAMAWNHWQLASSRPSGKINVALFNPTLEDHGWQSSTTHLQIVLPQMPFLVDSVRMNLSRMKVDHYHYISLSNAHILRTNQGKYKDFKGLLRPLSKVPGEQFFSLEMTRLSDEKIMNSVKTMLLAMLSDLQAAVEDWQLMKDKLQVYINNIEEHANNTVSKEQLKRQKAFLKWMLKYFTFLGSRDLRRQGMGAKSALKINPDSGLGVLRLGRQPGLLDKIRRKKQAILTRKQPQDKSLILISKTNTPSTLHRPTCTDYLMLRSFDDQGKVIGELRFVGLFTSDAYENEPLSIPMIKDKVNEVIKTCSPCEDLYRQKRLLHIIRMLPRDELFQAPTSWLTATVRGIFDMQERRKLKAFFRIDHYQRYVSCLVYLPRHDFSTEIRLQMQSVLIKILNGIGITALPMFSESNLAQVYFVIRINENSTVDIDQATLELSLRDVAFSWYDLFNERLLNHYGQEKGQQLIDRYSQSFTSGYRSIHSSNEAFLDVKFIENLNKKNDLEIYLKSNPSSQDSHLRLKLYQYNKHIALSEALPILENMGLNVISDQSSNICLTNAITIWMSEYTIDLNNYDFNIDIAKSRDVFSECLDNVWHGRCQSDPFNALVLLARLHWREVMLLRAYVSYLKQVKFSLTQDSIQKAFIAHPSITKLLITYFHCRFDPNLDEDRVKLSEQIEAKINESLDGVKSLDYDRIFRRMTALIKATLRCNYYQKTSGEFKPYISIKFDSKCIPEIPLPAPQYDTFVYAMAFEGIHLRADMGQDLKVARGGFRWSSRLDDYRTEVLGLMKAQQVKNVIIVPAGAKGGFVVKSFQNSDHFAQVKHCYQLFVSGLLDLTDNIEGDQIIAPCSLVRYDGDDPYIVAAADKGTATFSDLANEIATNYGYWLADAFASGGSMGYDHKKLAITAKGAWESIISHCRSLDIDMNKPFSVVGIGDMSGDVFGNGMLLNKNIALKAAFNHLHIFVDPDPDVSSAFKERQRLFNMPGSQWKDYSKRLISNGGGVFSRQAKTIAISSQMQTALGITDSVMTPSQLIQAILRAPVDILWNGGIGTYVKSQQESHHDVGDHANDELRVDAHELRCRIVGEGGNLGFTQLARIAYEQIGGSINTDFIDNSGGVDCSDHEVNIKILLNRLVQDGQLTGVQRDQYLMDLTPKVVDLVLKNNRKQNLAISLAALQVPIYYDLYIRFIQKAEADGYLNRQVEYLPTDKALVERRSSGMHLTRPELAILLSYSKLICQRSMMDANIFDDPYIMEYAKRAFPQVMAKDFPQGIDKHYLRKGIIACQISNLLVTELGIVFLQQLQDELGVSIEQIIKAFIIAREVFYIDDILNDIEQLAEHINFNEQSEHYLALRNTMRRQVRWLLHHALHHLNVSDCIARFQPQVKIMFKHYRQILHDQDRVAFDMAYQNLIKYKVNKTVAYRLACLPLMQQILNIIEARANLPIDIQNFARLYFILSDALSLNWVRKHLNALPIENRWDVSARVMLKSELDRCQRDLLTAMCINRDQDRLSHFVDADVFQWIDANDCLSKQWLANVSEAKSSSIVGMPVFVVLLKALHESTRLVHDP